MAYIRTLCSHLRRRTSENSVKRKFRELTFRDCPKRVGGACPVALQSTKTALFDPFLPPSTSNFALRALFVPLFGQSQCKLPRIPIPRTPVNSASPRPNGVRGPIAHGRLVGYYARPRGSLRWRGLWEPGWGRAKNSAPP